MNKYTKLRSIKGNEAIELKKGPSRLLLCPDMGGRAFAEVAGIVPHRIDLQAAARPGDDFNNYGGNNLWPAPEGGVYGFNYKGNGWYVQPAVNTQPFEVAASKENNILESMPGRPEIDGRQPATAFEECDCKRGQPWLTGPARRWKLLSAERSACQTVLPC